MCQAQSQLVHMGNSTALHCTCLEFQHVSRRIHPVHLVSFTSQMFPVEKGETYRAVMPFYMWPVAHAECSRRLLSLLAQEGKVPGTSFRRKILVESNLGLQLRNTE